MENKKDPSLFVEIMKDNWRKLFLNTLLKVWIYIEQNRVSFKAENKVEIITGVRGTKKHHESWKLIKGKLQKTLAYMGWAELKSSN